MSEVLAPQKKGKKETSKETAFSLVSEFRGYRHKEDKTNLAPGYLVEGSQNVLTTTGGDKVTIRKGFTLDGQEDMTIAPILSSFDWLSHTGEERNLRAGNLILSFRYVANAGDKYLTNTFTAGQVFWIPIFELDSNNVNFTDYWDTTNLISSILFVQGQPAVYQWTGGVTTLLSATSNTITKTGTKTWAEEGFSPVGSVTINGTDYAYTAGTDTDTLTGTDDASGEPANSVIFETVITTASSSITALPNNYVIDLIEVRKNQVYYGSFADRSVYVSKENDYTSVAFTSPVRIVGEGGLLTLDAAPIGFINQEDAMYITAGKNWWYQTLFQLSADNAAESLTINPLKTSEQQASQSQGLISKIKNSVIFISGEPTLDELGRVTGVINTPISSNISDPIKLDFDSYDFTYGHMFYFQNFIYLSVPVEGLVRIFNIAKGYWEAPLILPISRFAVINGELYGHSYQTPQTFKLFTGYNDNGNPIEAKAIFSYNQYGKRAETKFFNEFYYEGYIQQNTLLNIGIKYEIDGCSSIQTYTVNGADTQVVCIPPTDASLGKVPLGKNPLGGSLDAVNNLPKMRGIKTFPRLDFYEVQFSFSSIGIDYAWEILAFGPLVTESPSNNNNIKQ